MKNIFLLTILFNASACFGQKIVSNGVDKFTGVKAVSTSIETIDKFNFNKIQAYAAMAKDTTGHESYRLYIIYYTGYTISLDDKQNAIFIFKTGEKMTRKYGGSYDIRTRGEVVIWSVDLDKEDFQTIASNVITDIRLEANGPDTDISIKEKFQKVIPELCSLILNAK